MIVLIIISIIILGIIVESAINIKRLDVSFNCIEAPCDAKFVVVSDLHGYCYGNDNDKLIARIINYNPDYVLIPGDLVVKNGKKLDVSLSFLKQVSELGYKIIYCPGNHELKLEINNKALFDDFIEKVKALNVIYLDDSIYDCGSFSIIGYTNKIEQYSKFKKLYPLKADDIKNSVPSTNKYCVMLAHNPIYFKEYAKTNARFIVSGHLHGGIVRLPFIGGILSPQTFFSNAYNNGIYKEGKSIMYVSRGLGLHTIPLRLNNRPELGLIRLKK